MYTQTNFTTTATIINADIYTPVGIYLRLRDKYRDVLLLESADYTTQNNSYSFIAINALAGIQLNTTSILEYRTPLAEAKEITTSSNSETINYLELFVKSFIPTTKVIFPVSAAQGLFGYTSYNSVTLTEDIDIKNDNQIPLMRFRFYQYVIAINHYKNELTIIENHLPNLPSLLQKVYTHITMQGVPQFPFSITNTETCNITDEAYLAMVQQGIHHCNIGDVFQVVLSRRYSQQYLGDDFNVYRALRNINPSPYLFYFDYGSYRLMGSSPEAQLVIKNNTATIHPIAGTVRRTGDTVKDAEQATLLANDAKENAEHTMLVDLARNDLSRFCTNVQVTQYKHLQYYSHLIHMVSQVQGTIINASQIFSHLLQCFPTGTLSGAPKVEAMHIINKLEKEARNYYGGAIGMIGFDGTVNMAILIRSFLSQNNTLQYQAGAGVVAASTPSSELQEVNNKIGALRAAIIQAYHPNTIL